MLFGLIGDLARPDVGQPRHGRTPEGLGSGADRRTDILRRSPEIHEVRAKVRRRFDLIDANVLLPSGIALGRGVSCQRFQAFVYGSDTSLLRWASLGRRHFRARLVRPAE